MPLPAITFQSHSFTLKQVVLFADMQIEMGELVGNIVGDEVGTANKYENFKFFPIPSGDPPTSNGFFNPLANCPYILEPKHFTEESTNTTQLESTPLYMEDIFNVSVPRSIAGRLGRVVVGVSPFRL